MNDTIPRCQRVISTGGGRDRCALEAAWTGWLHAGRDIYVTETCDRHKSGLIDAEPLDGDWDRSQRQSPSADRSGAGGAGDHA